MSNQLVVSVITDLKELEILGTKRSFISFLHIGKRARYIGVVMLYRYAYSIIWLRCRTYSYSCNTNIFCYHRWWLSNYETEQTSISETYPQYLEEDGSCSALVDQSSTIRWWIARLLQFFSQWNQMVHISTMCLRLNALVSDVRNANFMSPSYDT